MTLARALLAALALAGVTAAAPAQGLGFGSPQVYDDSGPQYLVSPATDDVVSLEGLDAIGRPRVAGRRPLIAGDLLGGDGNSRRGDDENRVRRGSGIRGGVGNTAVGNHTNLNVGFTYLMPLYNFRDFQRPTPRGFEGLFPVFGNDGPADNSFAFSPRLDLNYYVEDADFTVSTSGVFLSLSGRVDRQANVPGPVPVTGQLNAQSTLTLISAIPIEFGRIFEFESLFPRKAAKHQKLAESLLDLRLGSRYVSIDQHYTGVTTAAGNTSTRYSSQSFRGLGVTAASVLQIPCGDSWVPFLSTRQSLVVGENRRNSSVSVNAGGTTFSDSQFDDRTILVPITEIEAGFDWGMNLAEALRANVPGPAFTLRVAGVGQYWYGMGPLSAGANNQGFRRNDLYLVGGYLQAGLKY